MVDVPFADMINLDTERNQDLSSKGVMIITPRSQYRILKHSVGTKRISNTSSRIA